MSTDRSRPRPTLAALGALVTLLVLAASEASAQFPGDPVPMAPVGPARPTLAQEFAEKLRYPFYAIPQAFESNPRRVALRPRFEGGTELVELPPEPARPLYVSGYAGRQNPARRLLAPTSGRRGLFGVPTHHGGH